MEKSTLLDESGVFCIAPWTHMHVLTKGEIFPCCMSAQEAANAIGNLRQGGYPGIGMELGENENTPPPHAPVKAKPNLRTLLQNRSAGAALLATF